MRVLDVDKTVDPTTAIIKILKPNGRTEGTGFIVSRTGLIATCSHVVTNVGARPGDKVSIQLKATGEKRTATVLPEAWTDINLQDVAYLRLDGALSDLCRVMPLGSDQFLDVKEAKTYGYSLGVSKDGMPGDCELVGPNIVDGSPAHTLRSNEIDHGFSGAPVWHPELHCAIGMIFNVFDTPSPRKDQPPKPVTKGLLTAFMRPVSLLRSLYPEVIDTTENPYRGLQAYRNTDADDYYGRSDAIRRLVTLLSEHDFVSVIGLSGSGKSSLLRAGLTKGLQQYNQATLAGRIRCETTPGGYPTIALLTQILQFSEWSWERFQDALGITRLPLTGDELSLKTNMERLIELDVDGVAAAIKQSLGGQKALLTIDQFEQIFTGCTHEKFRTSFMDLLIALPKYGVKIVIGVRADYIGHAFEYDHLSKAIQGSLILTSMDRQNLSECIEQPARHRECGVDPRLVRQLIDDVYGRAGDLPLLSFTLEKLWETDAKKGILTLETYKKFGQSVVVDEDIGGVQAVLIGMAEQVWELLSPEERIQAEWVFLSLVAEESILGGQENIKKSAGRRALLAEYSDGTRATAIKLHESFLLTFGHDTVRDKPTIQVAHEALLWTWPRMVTLINQYRPFLNWYNTDFSVRLNQYIASRQSKDQLLPKAALRQASIWYSQHPERFAGPPLEYIKQSLKVRKATMTRRVVFAGIAILCLLIAGAKYNQQTRQQQAREYIQQGKDAQAARDYTTAQKYYALALKSVDDPTTRQTLLDVAAQAPHLRVVQNGTFKWLATAASGSQTLVDMGKGIVAVYDTNTLKRRSISSFISSKIAKGALSSDGSVAAVSCSDGSYYIWDIAKDQVSPLQIAGSNPGAAVAVSPNGRSVVVSDELGRTWVYDRVTKKKPVLLRPNSSDPFWCIAFSPDGRKIAAGGESTDVYIWQVASWQKTIYRSVSNDVISSIAFNADSDLLAVGAADTNIRLINLKDGSRRVLSGHSDAILDVAFSPTGSELVSCGQDKTVRIWNVANSVELQLINIGDRSVTSATFTNSGSVFYWEAPSSAEPGLSTLRVVDQQNPRFGYTLRYGEAINQVVMSPDGNSIAIAGTQRDSSGHQHAFVAVTNMAIHAQYLIRPAGDRSITAAAYSPTGDTFAAACLDGYARVWDTSSWTELASIKHPSPVVTVLYLSDTQLLSGDRLDGKQARLTLADPHGHSSINIPYDQGSVFSTALDVKHSFLALGGGDNRVLVLSAQSLPERKIVFEKKKLNTSIWAVGFVESLGKLLVGDGSVIRVYDLLTKHSDKELPSQCGDVYSFATMPNSNLAAAAGSGGSIDVWDMTKECVILSFHDHTGPIWRVAWDSSGRWLASASMDGSVRVRDMQSIRELTHMNVDQLLHALVEDNPQMQ